MQLGKALARSGKNIRPNIETPMSKLLCPRALARFSRMREICMWPSGWMRRLRRRLRSKKQEMDQACPENPAKHKQHAEREIGSQHMFARAWSPSLDRSVKGSLRRPAAQHMPAGAWLPSLDRSLRRPAGVHCVLQWRALRPEGCPPDAFAASDTSRPGTVCAAMLG